MRKCGSGKASASASITVATSRPLCAALPQRPFASLLTPFNEATPFLKGLLLLAEGAGWLAVALARRMLSTVGRQQSRAPGVPARSARSPASLRAARACRYGSPPPAPASRRVNQGLGWGGLRCKLPSGRPKECKAVQCGGLGPRHLQDHARALRLPSPLPVWLRV